MSLVPFTQDKYIGIEIECFGDITEDRLETLLDGYNIGDYVEIGSDGSIEWTNKDFNKNELSYQTRYIRKYRGYGYFAEEYLKRIEVLSPKYHIEGYELRVLVTQNEMKEVLTKLGQVLKKANLKVNKTCGLHVHLDMRNRDFDTCAKRLFYAQKLMRKLVNKNRLRNDYCRKVNNIEELLYPSDRYTEINTTHKNNSNKKTIEVRLHHGSIDMKEVYNWATFLIAVIDNDKEKAEFSKQDTYSKQLQNYFKEKLNG